MMSHRNFLENKEETIPSDDDSFKSEWPLQTDVTDAIMDFAEVYSQFSGSFSSNYCPEQNNKEKVSSDDEMFQEKWPLQTDVTDALMDFAGVYSEFTDSFSSETAQDENNTSRLPHLKFGELPVS